MGAGDCQRQPRTPQKFIEGPISSYRAYNHDMRKTSRARKSLPFCDTPTMDQQSRLTELLEKLSRKRDGRFAFWANHGRPLPGLKHDAPVSNDWLAECIPLCEHRLACSAFHGFSACSDLAMTICSWPISSDNSMNRVPASWSAKARGRSFSRSACASRRRRCAAALIRRSSCSVRLASPARCVNRRFAALMWRSIDGAGASAIKLSWHRDHRGAKRPLDLKTPI